MKNIFGALLMIIGVAIVLLLGCSEFSCARRSAGVAVEHDVDGVISASYAGLANLRGKTFDNLEVSGTAVLNDITADKISVSGALNGKKIKAATIEISGSAKLSDAHVKGHTTVAGALNSTDSTFNYIEIASEHVVLTNSQVKEITVKKIRTSKQQVVELVGTTVHGDVVFKTDGGQVRLKNGAEIRGKVVGATVV